MSLSRRRWPVSASTAAASVQIRQQAQHSRQPELVRSSGEFVAEIGVGVIHHAQPWTAPPLGEREAALTAAVKHEFDPLGRLNPGIHV